MPKRNSAYAVISYNELRKALEISERQRAAAGGHDNGGTNCLVFDCEVSPGRARRRQVTIKAARSVYGLDFENLV